MADFITADTFEGRLRQAVSVAWAIFVRKVGGKVISVNKEASMQLQYAYILQQLLPLTSHSPHEEANIELEPTAKFEFGTNEIDILLKSQSKKERSAIAIELKCYRTFASSGGPRGAMDIFMKDVYEDLNILEKYIKHGIANRGIALVMTDYKQIVEPSKKRGKCWAYDISNSHSIINGVDLSVPIGGRPVNIRLKKSYQFNWSKFGDFWFLELEGGI